MVLNINNILYIGFDYKHFCLKQNDNLTAVIIVTAKRQLFNIGAIFYIESRYLCLA